MAHKVRWGIAGLGKIAHSFADDLKLVDGAELHGVASRDLERAGAFGKQFGARRVFGSYRELFESEDVDVVYIATPHTSHAKLSIEAMRHGKHVLCEKPAGVNSAEVASMTKASGENGVFLMEAMWSRFNPAIKKVAALVGEGAIGEVKYLHADFAFYALDRAVEGRLLNPALGGGSLLDIGIYPVFLAYMLLGKPQKILASSHFSGEGGVEIQTAMLFEYASAHAVLYSGLSSKSEMKAEISGTLGNIYLHPRWHETQGYTLIRNGEGEDVELPTKGAGYTHEIEEVGRCIGEGLTESALWTHRNSLELMGLLDEIRRINGIRFPFEA